jgi:hypothetical protein
VIPLLYTDPINKPADSARVALIPNLAGIVYIPFLISSSTSSMSAILETLVARRPIAIISFSITSV